MSSDELTDDLISEIIADAEEYVGLSQSAVRKGWRIGDKLLKAKDAMPSSSWHAVSRSAQSTRTGRAAHSTTSVIRPSPDWRANSTGTSGPSSNHSDLMGSSRGSQMSDPIRGMRFVARLRTESMCLPYSKPSHGCVALRFRVEAP